MVTKPVLAAWGSGALVVAGAGVVALVQLSPEAAATPPAEGVTAAAPGTPRGGATRSPAPQPPPKALVVTVIASDDVPVGSDQLVLPIAPGVDGTITARVENPNNQPVRMTGVSGAVTAVTQGASGPVDCEVDWFEISSLTGLSSVIPKRSSRDVELDVAFTNLPTTNQDRCKGARYTFSLTATAVQA